MEYAPVTKEFGASSCFWVAGQYKDHGCRYELLGKCIRDSKEKGKICASAGRGRKPKYNSPENRTHGNGRRLRSLLYPPFKTRRF